MSVLEFSMKDINAGISITPGWLKSTILSATIGPSKDKQSINYTLRLSPHIPDCAPEDRPEVVHTFNSKMQHTMLPFICAIKKTTMAQIEADAKAGNKLKFDFQTESVGNVLVKYDNELFDGRVINKVKGFLNVDDQVPF